MTGTRLQSTYTYPSVNRNSTHNYHIFEHIWGFLRSRYINFLIIIIIIIISATRYLDKITLGYKCRWHIIIHLQAVPGTYSPLWKKVFADINSAVAQLQLIWGPWVALSSLSLLRTSSWLLSILRITSAANTVTFGPRSFASSAPKLWNSLPLPLRDSTLTLRQFSSRLKTHLFSLAYGRASWLLRL